MDGEQIAMMGMGAGILGLLIAFMLYRKVDSIEIENKTVATITGRIQDGAMAILNSSSDSCYSFVFNFD